MTSYLSTIRAFWQKFNANPVKHGGRIAEEVVKLAAEGNVQALQILERVTQ